MPGDFTKLVVLSRATAVRKPDRLCFQALDGRYIAELAELLGRLTLLCPVVDEADASYQLYSGYQFELEQDKLEVVELPRFGWRQWRLLWGSIHKGDLVLAFMPTFQAVAGVLIAMLKRTARIVYLGSDWRDSVLTGAGRPAPLRHLRALVYALLQGLTMRLATLRIVAGSKLLAQYEALGATYQTISMRQLGPDDLFHRDDTHEDDTLRLLCVSSLTPRKGLPYLLQASQTLQREGVSFSLRIVGAGDNGYRAYLQQLAVDYEIVDRVHFEGYVGDTLVLLQLYRSADVFVLPSLHEGYPRAVDEAMSQSLPVVCTAVGGVPRTLTDGEHALIVPPGNAQALGEAIKRMKQDSSLRRSLIVGGRSRVLAEMGSGISAAEQLIALAKRHHLVPQDARQEIGSSNPSA